MRAWTRRGLSEVLGGLIVAIMVTGALLAYVRAFNSLERAGKAAVDAVEAEALGWALRVERVDGGVTVYNPLSSYVTVRYVVVNTSNGVVIMEYNETVPPRSAISIPDPVIGEVIAVVTDGGAVSLARDAADPATSGQAATAGPLAMGAYRKLWIIAGLGEEYYSKILAYMLDIEDSVDVTVLRANFTVRVVARSDEAIYNHDFKITINVNGERLVTKICVTYPGVPCTVTAGPVTVVVNQDSVAGRGYDDIEVRVAALTPPLDCQSEACMIIFSPENASFASGLRYGNLDGYPTNIIVHERNETWVEPPVWARLYSTIPAHLELPSVEAALKVSLRVTYEDSYVIYTASFAVPAVVAGLAVVGGGGESVG